NRSSISSLSLREAGGARAARELPPGRSRMSIFFRAFRRKSDGLPPWAALDQESLRISAAMEHIQDQGNLDAFPGGQNERLALLPGSSSKLPARDRAAVAAASKPSDAGNAPRQAQAPGQTPAPRQEEVSVARNPGIPCLAEKCLETGGASAGPKPEPPKAETQ